jgi:hypothetical protein
MKSPGQMGPGRSWMMCTLIQADRVAGVNAYDRPVGTALLFRLELCLAIPPHARPDRGRHQGHVPIEQCDHERPGAAVPHSAQTLPLAGYSDRPRLPPCVNRCARKSVNFARYGFAWTPAMIPMTSSSTRRGSRSWIFCTEVAGRKRSLVGSRVKPRYRAPLASRVMR